MPDESPIRLTLQPEAKERILLRKPLNDILEQAEKGPHLRRALGPFQLTALGVGAIVGTGIFVLIGPATGNYAGPSIVVSMLIAALTCGLIALCYAELASMIPVAGSAYTYSYATLGEFFAWIIGWDLVLEYAVGAVAVAIGWSGYLYTITRDMGMPYGLTHPPSSCSGGECGVINIPAIAIVLGLTFLLGRGVKEAVNLNTVIVLIKLFALVVFLLVGATVASGAAFSPFQPMGWGGTFTGAALIFFAFIGFDAVSTAAEEAKNPEKDMKTAILGSLGVATVIYISVALVLVGLTTGVGGAFPMSDLAGSPAALAEGLSAHGQILGASIVAVGALAAITSVLLVSLYAQPRLFFALARDGLLPPRFAELDPKSGVPKKTIYLTGFTVAFFAGFVGIGEAAELTNIGTLFAFILVGIGIIWLRKNEPNAKRPFRAPLFPIVPMGAIAMSIVLIIALPNITKLRFLLWLGVGILIYTEYGIKHSKLGRKRMGLPPEDAAPPTH